MLWLSPKWMFCWDEKGEWDETFPNAFFTGVKGVPLKGPFLGHFSQGNLSKVNEIVHFSDFRMFCIWSLLRLVVLTPLRLAF